jgi:hypothetical protein
MKTNLLCLFFVPTKKVEHWEKKRGFNTGERLYKKRGEQEKTKEIVT